MGINKSNVEICFVFVYNTKQTNIILALVNLVFYKNNLYQIMQCIFGKINGQ